jgi:hypothetical protein
MELTLRNRTFGGPILVPSVSSFETQLSPEAGLGLQFALQEPISLVSAFDVDNEPDKLVPLCKKFRYNGILLMDSGGYEAARIRRYRPKSEGGQSSKVEETWSFSRYKSICDFDIYDFVFSYDYFIEENESVDDFELRLMSDLPAHLEFVKPDRLIPVLHTQSEKGHRRLDISHIIQLVTRIASELQPQFVAIPERELGDGILQRAANTRAIVQELRQLSRRTDLHILGCGNLLSFTLLSAAGAAMCDGLEWCRTYASDQFHHHHFQHLELFESARTRGVNPASLVLDSELSYRLQAAGRNLVSFQAFTELEHLSEQSVHALVRRFFGDQAANALQGSGA